MRGKSSLAESLFGGTLRAMKTRTDSARKAAADLARARRKQAAVIAAMRKLKKDWRKFAGTMQDTPESREAWALGEAYRKAQKSP